MIYKNFSDEAAAELERQRLDDAGEIKDKVYTCESCGSDIYDGDDCIVAAGGVFCRSCVVMMTSEDVVELLGHSFITADKNDIRI